jgi:hypothetical protein
MPTYTKQFARPEYQDHDIQKNSSGQKIGTIRVKPVSVLWKPANAPKFYSVSLEKFAEWIMAPSTGAFRTRS